MKKIFTLCVVLCLSYLTMGASTPKHEFRATWLTTAWGNDWPKTKVTNATTRKQQQDSLIAIFDRLQAGNMNAVCLQVRGRSDAFYQSSYEPWAAELAGARGTNPGYDPLAFAIEEAHKRGLELHAWVNPFRVTSAGTLDANDLVKKNAGQWIIQYNNGSFTGEIIDPGYPEAREYVLNVLMEIISNYDIDGIVMDDYFYPYGGTTTEDAASKALHKPANVVDVNQDGDTDDDWRRSNVDVFLKELYDRIQAKKPWVRFGMGTFGIWTTQSKVAQAYGISLPSGISGLDDYDVQACNPVEWVKNGYVDYINPQLYWPTTSTGQNYNKLCQWWAKDVCEHFSNQLTNGKKVHFFSSQSISANPTLTEIQSEIDVNRNNLSSGYTGSVFFDTDAYLTMDKDLMTSRFATNALTPPMDWKSNTALAAPTNLTVSGSTLTWQHATAERFTVYAYPKGTAWSTAKNDPAYLQGVIYGNSLDISGIDTNMNDIAVCAYDRFGVEHTAAVYSNDSGAGTTPNPETIIWELNGGEVNTVTVEVPNLTTLEAQFKNDYNSYFGASVATTREITNFLYYGSKEEGGSNLVYNMMNDPASDWKWLRDYIISKSASNTTIQTALLAGTDAHWRYSIVAFLTASAGTNSTYTVDFSTAGQPSKWGPAYQIAHGAVLLPTYVTSAFTLPIPTHPEGHDFLGWYDNAEFIGSPLTTISADWTGSLYAKWQEDTPTIDPTWQITYTSSNDSIVTPYATDVFGANIVSNTYENGVGTITFDGPVTSIGEHAFYNCYGLTSITIPNSVTSIGNRAFMHTFLSSITIPNSVTSIGELAFCRCMPLTAVTIPYSVISIGANPFYGCSGLVSIVVEEGNMTYDSRNDCKAIVETATNTLIAGCQNTVIPNNITSIGNYAFIDCTGLTSVTIPYSVKSIGIAAFANCSSLSLVIIPRNVTSIGVQVFNWCSSLTSIVVEEGNSVYDSRENCNAIIETATNILIAGCQNTIVPNNVTGFGFEAFRGHKGLTSIIIPNKVTSIEQGTFWECSSLTSITIPNRVTNIGESAFEGCRSLTSITIPNSVTSIGDYAFEYCSSLTSITIPNSVTSIGYEAFRDCSSLDTIHVEATTPPTLGENVFYGTPSPICVIPCGTLATYQSSDWANYMGRFVEECTDPASAVTFDADVDKGNAVTESNNAAAYQISKNGVTLDVSSGMLGTYNNEMHYRIFKNNSITVTSVGRNITKIEFICTANNDERFGPGCFTVDGGDYTYSDAVGTWTGDAAIVTFNASANQVRATQIIVTLVDEEQRITYKQNGGITNDYGWTSKGAIALDLQADYNAAYGTSKAWAKAENGYIYYKIGTDWVREDLIPEGTDCTVTGFMQNVTYNTTDDLKKLINDNEKYTWLKDVIITSRTAAGLDVTDANLSETVYRKELSAFFLCSPATSSWPASSSYETAGQYEFFKAIWRHAFANPTNPTEEFVLNAPYKEGYTFAGWYTNAEFSGDKVTTVNSETTGTLYAKWVEYIPTIAEVWKIEEGVETKISGVVNWVRGGNVFIQDITGGFRIYIPNDTARLIPEIGTKIIAKGIRGSYAGSPTLNDAVIESSEPATLAEPIVTTLADLCANPLKYFGQRVSVQGVYVAEYDNYSNIYLSERDGSNKVKGHYMVVDPIAFPVGTKVSITAVASCYNGDFQFEGDVAGIELTVIGKKENYEYPIRNEKYTLTNDWVISNVEGNFAANKPGSTGYVRGMAAKDGIMYFINRETESIVRVDGETGHMLDPIKLTGEHLFEVYDEEMGEWESGVIFGYNDIKFDQVGNCLIGSMMTGATRCQHFMIYTVDLATGECTLLIDDVLWDNPGLDQVQFRFDAFGVAGDVTKNGVVMTADAQSWNVYRWLIKNGVVGDGEQINCALNAEIDESLFIETENFGTAPQIFPQDELGELFYVDGASTLPMLFDVDGMLLDDFINVPTGTNVWNSNGDTISINNGYLNGLIEFQVGEEYFLLMAATYSSHNVPSTFALYKFADENRAFSSMEPLWYFPHNGMGSNTNGYRTAVPSVDIIDNNTAKLYLYVGENGYACYTLTLDNVASDEVINEITYELNGGVTNDYGWMNKGQMFEAFMTDAGATGFKTLDYYLQQADPYSDPNICTKLTNASPALQMDKWAWLKAYIEAAHEAQAAEGASSLTADGTGAAWRYAVAAFFVSGQRTFWPKSADFSELGLDNVYLSAWQHAYDNPTNPTEEFVLNAPYKEGYTFAGWYTNADFSGEKVTTINAETTGTLYAKWIDETWQITYTSSNDSIVTPYATDVFGANIVSNTYENGVGTITFDGPVTTIGDHAFHKCPSLTSITIPNSVTSIGYSTFSFCFSLTSVTIPNSVTSIGDQAFSDCSALTSVTIPNSVTSIGHIAFYYCSSLTSIVVEQGNTIYDSRNNCNAIIETATNTLVAGCQNTMIPNNVTSIGVGAFEGCEELHSINIPNNILKIATYAFFGCSKLISITIPNSVTFIGQNAFGNCDALVSITVDSTNSVYDSRDNCNAIIYTAANYLSAGCQNTIIPNSVTEIGSYAFGDCNSLTSIVIPNSVRLIGGCAFYSCKNLTSITIPKSVTAIAYGAFMDCSELNTIHIESTTPPTLVTGAFTSSPTCYIPCGTLAAYQASDWAGQVSEFVEDGCIDPTWQILYTSTDGNIVTPNRVDVFGANIVSNNYENGQGTITFDGPVTSIGDEAFAFCDGLTSITIPNSVTSIGDRAFCYCSGLTSITIPDSVTSIGEYAFRICSGLTSITIPNSVTSIRSTAFSHCESIVSMVVADANAVYDSRNGCNAIIETATNTLVAGCQNTIIPNSVINIGEQAFDCCHGLTSIAIPNSITSIGYSAFSYCSSLSSVTIPNSVTSIGSFAFGFCINLASVFIPNSITNIESTTFYSCTSLTSITIPNSVTHIGHQAFLNCTSLTTIHVEATTPPALEDSTVFMNTPSPICVIPCGTLAAYQASDWASQVSEFVEEGCVPIQMCGDDLYWEYADGVLTITGTGDMYDYADGANVPWYDVRGNIKTVILPDAMTKIGQNAFYRCTNLTTINMPASLIAIGEKAFAQDSKLIGALTLPATLAEIGERAFYNCIGVDRYTIQAMTPPVLGDDVFKYANANTGFYVSCEALDAYKAAVGWSSLNLRDACLNIYHYGTPLGANGVHTTEDTLVASIYYRRQFTPNSWETLYLPFEVDRVTVLEDGVEYDLNAWSIFSGGHYYLAKPYGIENKEVVFGFTQVVDAHTPYIIQFKDVYYRDKIITFYGKESWNKLSTSFEMLPTSFEMQMAGNTTLQDQILDQPVYMLRGASNFILQNTTTTLHPFECYVMPYATSSATPTHMSMRFRGDVPTAVESVKGNESYLTYTVDGYTLTVYPQGQAFSIYSLNGALIYSCEAGKEAVDCELNSGCYLLHAGTEAHKIML